MTSDHQSTAPNSAAKRGGRTLGVIAVVVAGIAGCGFDAKIRPALEATPAVEQLPLTIGVHYPSALRDYRIYHWLEGYRGPEATSTIDPGGATEYALGPPSITLFDQVYSSMFARTVPVINDPAASPWPSDAAAIVVLQIDSFRPHYVMGHDIAGGPMIESIVAEIVYRTTVLTPQGQRIAEWTTIGSGTGYPTAFSFSEEIGNAAAMAMREAAAKFVAGFRQQPEVAKWLADLNLTSAPPP